MTRSTVYGPVASWRLSRSLGIDMLCTEQKSCNFDCVYCQFGPTIKPQTERQEFVSLAKLIDDLNAVKGVAADWATFSGMGEPTLAANLGAAITMAKSVLELPVAVFTNGSLITREDVRRELALADMVILKLDASDETLFRAINQPSAGIEFASIVQGYQTFRMEYNGKLALDIMMCDMNKGNAFQLQYMARFPRPDQVQLNTAIRPCGITPMPMAELKSLHQNWFFNLGNTINVYEAKRPEVIPLNVEETELRYPTKPKIDTAEGQATASDSR